MKRENILEYVKQKYETVPDFPWYKYPDYAVLRHEKSRKWYGVLMKVAKLKLGIKGEGTANVLNLKCDMILASLMNHPDIMPAYHMNKRHWISVILDGELPREEVCRLIDLSYDLTK